MNVARSELRAVAAMLAAVNPTDIRLPPSILPADGRFGCGPSKVRREQIDLLIGDIQRAREAGP